MFRVTHKREGIDDTDTIEGARQIARGQPPGRYDIDEIRGEPFPSEHTSRSWERMETHERRTRDMTERIEIQFDEDEGHLRLDCREDEFIHIRDLVVTGTSAADRLRPFREGIRSIVVRRMDAVQDPMPRRSVGNCRSSSSPSSCPS